MEKEEKIRNVESEIDNAYRKYKLYQLQNRPLAQWYLLLMHEESARLPIIKKTAEKIPLNWFEIICSFEISKASLQFSLKWTDELPDKKFHIPKKIDWEIYEHAHDFFSLAENYYSAIAPFILYSRGLASATIEDEFTIRFSRDLRESAFDFLGLMKMQDPARCLKSYANPPKAMEEEIDNILMTAKPLGKQGLTYKVNHKNLAPLIAYFLEEMNKRTYLTDEWSIKGISATELKCFFASLKSYCMVHIRCMSNFDLLSMVEALGSASSLLTKPCNDWIRFISKCAGVSLDRVQALLDILTYDRMIKKRDISLQPFINVSDDTLTICPFLVYNSNLERNFLALISKKFKFDYDKKSYIFEKKMIDRCAKIAEAASWKFTSNRPIIGMKSMPDIDAAFYDLTSKCLLLCQLKAVIPPSEPAEVLERSEREREGIEQSKLIKELAERSPELLWQSCFTDMEYPAPKIFHAVILQGSFGSVNSISANIPSLELDHFEEITKKFDTLVELCEYISSFSYLPKVDIDYTLTDSVIDFGKYKIIWDGFTPKN